MTRSRSVSPSRSCLGRTMPSTTGSTASRWLGLGATDTTISRPDGRAPDAARAEVILHVARTLRAGGIDVAFEFGENLRERLADDVGQYVQPAAMRHADDDFVDVVRGGALEQFVENGDRRFAAFEREPLLADESRVQKMLELFGLDQSAAECARAFRDPAASYWPPAPCAAAASASAPGAGCSCTRIRPCRSRSGAAFRGFRAAWRPASVRLHRLLPPGEPVRNSRSKSQMVRP